MARFGDATDFPALCVSPGVNFAVLRESQGVVGPGDKLDKLVGEDLLPESGWRCDWIADNSSFGILV